MKELERQIYGAEKYNKTAINRHAVRFYEHNGRRINIDKTLDALPPFYEVYEGAKQLNVYIPDGTTWKIAEMLTEHALNYI